MVAERSHVWIRTTPLVAFLILWSCTSTKSGPADQLDAQQWRSSKSHLYLDLAQQCLQAGEHARAKSLLEQSVEFSGGKDTRALEALARVSFAQGDHAQAAIAARTLLSADPGSAAAMCMLGAVAEVEGRTAEAETAYRRAISAHGDDPRPCVALHRLYLTTGRNGEAERLRGELLAKFPTLVEVWLDHGAQLAVVGSWSEAVTAYRHALDVQPDNLDAATRYASSALACGRPEDVLALGKTLPPRARLGNPTLCITLATAHLRCGDHAAALQELDLIDRNLTTGATLPILRGEVLLHLGRLDEARETLEGAVARDPGIARAHATLGRVLLRQGRPHAAMRALRSAGQLEPNNGTTQALLAASLAATGDVAIAREHLRRARALPGTESLVAEAERTFPALAEANGTEQRR